MMTKPSAENLEYYAAQHVGQYFLVYLFLNRTEEEYAEWFGLTPLFYNDESPFIHFRERRYTETDLMAGLITGDLSTTKVKET